MNRYILPGLVLLLLAGVATAGGGPETTLVVVNSRSPVSKRVANEYVAMRDIPRSHVVYLDGIPHQGVITLEQFKDRVWKPIQEFMDERGLEDRIDLVTYSADFPFGVNFRPLLENPKAPVRTIGGIASLSGATYLVRHLLAGDVFWDLTINRYFRLQAPRPPTAEERGLATRAATALQRRDYAGAAKAFEALLATYDYTSGPWYNYACCLARLGKTDPALEALGKAVARGFTDRDHASTDPDLASLRSMPEFRALLDRIRPVPKKFMPAHGFSSRYSWVGKAVPIREGGEPVHRYYLSTHLAYTGFRGNSVPEVLRYLGAAADSDGKRPDGTVYVCRNGDVRSKAREPFFHDLVGALEALGRKAAILNKGEDGQTGVIPVGKDDVMGAVVGIANFDWEKSGSRILPGAIVESLTSHGGNFNTAGQTKLTAFLRHGAAGASGTVVEPLSIHQKFPNPMIHAFYADGCSLAEAFYQSVWGPYQLIVVGDGLARPFAAFPEVSVDAPKGPWKGTVTLGPSGDDADFELWVDGRFVASGESLELDTTKLDDGHHDVRVVAVARDRIETRSTRRVEAVVANHLKGKRIQCKVRRVTLGNPISVRASGVREVQVWHGARMLASTRKSRCEVASEDLGPGPARLEPRLVYGSGKVWRGAPIDVEVVAPDPVRSPVRNRPTAPGLEGKATLAKGEKKVVVTHIGPKREGKPLRERLKDLKGLKRLELVGEMEVRADGLYQLVLDGNGEVTLEVAGRTLCEKTVLGEQLYLPVSLAKGWHPIRITLVPKGTPHLSVRLGGDQVLASPKLRH